MRTITRKSTQLLGVVFGITAASLLVLPTIAGAASATTTTQTTVQQQHLATIKAKGNQEITRRLGQLNKLDAQITAATHLTASDKTTLDAEVNTEIAGLTTLKTTLDGETTLAAAITDAQSIISDYRVYALITPKVWLIKFADDQQTVEAKLTTLAGKLQTRITADKTAGKDVTSMQTSLNDMNTQVTNATNISSAIETKVLPLQPTDYDNDHTILAGDYTQLKTAHGDNEAAYTDAKTIVSDLTSQ